MKLGCFNSAISHNDQYRHIVDVLFVCVLVWRLDLQQNFFTSSLQKEKGLTDSPAPGKSGTAAGWKALRAFSVAPRQAHVIPSKRRANILQSAWYLPEACIVHLRSRPKYQNILRMSNEPASQPSSEDKAPLLISEGFSSWSCGAHTHAEYS